MKVKYSISPSTVHMVEGIIEDKISGSFILQQDNFGNFFLARTNDFKLPAKIYGGLEVYADRFLKKFDSEDNNLGISLTGEKGSGKTMLSELIAVKSGLPVIKILDFYHGDEFIKFINLLDSCVIILDEYDKTYEEKKQQNGLLQILESSGANKKLFILTSNTSHNLNDYMTNRPSRIHYKIEFSGLTELDIVEIVNDKLVNKEFIPDFIKLFSMYDPINFDLLNCIIKEVNLFNESPLEAVKIMNIKEKVQYSATLIYKSGKTTKQQLLGTRNPHDSHIYIDFDDDKYDDTYSDNLYKAFCNVKQEEDAIIWELRSEKQRANLPVKVVFTKQGFFRNLIF
jgi:hypothetical protein